jgi:hypothetical protein
MIERGYLIPAVGAQYEDCAQQLANSIRHFHPDAHITIVTAQMLPHGDLGGFANDWQLFQLSPYRQTIKLEADMIATSPIDHWWDLLALRDVVISQGCRNIYNETAQTRSYRQLFDENLLPDVYNAITYWRRSHTAKDFFHVVRQIFENYSEFKKLLKYPEKVPTTDVVYAMAATIIGVDKVTLPQGLGPQIVHMKRDVLGTSQEDWTQELIWEKDPFRINTCVQTGLVHYYIKTWRMR